MKLKELMVATGKTNVKTYDKKYGVDVSFEIDFDKVNKNNPDENFIDVLASEVDVVPNKRGDDLLCDWSGFVKNHKNALNNYMVEYWLEEYQIDSTGNPDYFEAQWINEIQRYFGGEGTKMKPGLIDVLKHEPTQRLTPGFVNFYDKTCEDIAVEYSLKQDEFGKEEFPPLTKEQILKTEKPKVIKQLYNLKGYEKFKFSDEEITKNLSLMSLPAISNIVDIFKDFDLVAPVVYHKKDIDSSEASTKEKVAQENDLRYVKEKFMKLDSENTFYEFGVLPKNSKVELFVEVHNGDWKHDHLYLETIVNNNFAVDHHESHLTHDGDDFNDCCDDTYSAEHIFIIDAEKSRKLDTMLSLTGPERK